MLKELQSQKVYLTSEEHRVRCKDRYSTHREQALANAKQYALDNKEYYENLRREQKFCFVCNGWKNKYAFSSHMATAKHQRNCVKIGG